VAVGHDAKGQEYEGAHISCGFRERDEFGFDGCHALSLEQQVAEVFVTATAASKFLSVVVRLAGWLLLKL
jgi:hypothetical protein